MKVYEIWALADFIKKAVSQSNLNQEIDKVISALQKSNSSHNVQEKKADTENAKIILEQALSLVPTREFTNNELTMLFNLSIDDVINKSPMNYFEDIFAEKRYSYSQQVSKLAATKANLNNAMTVVNALLNALPQVVDEQESVSFNEKQPVFRLIFQKEAKIDDIVELKDWAEKLFTILRGITIAHGGSPDTCKIVDTGKGSHWFDLLLDPTTIKILCDSISHIARAITEVLGTLTAYQALKLVSTKAKMQLRKLEELELDMAEEIKAKKDELLNSEVKRLINVYNLQADKQAEILSSLRKLYELLERGAVAELRDGSQSPEVKELQDKLNQSFLELKSQEKPLQLGNKSDTNHDI